VKRLVVVGLLLAVVLMGWFVGARLYDSAKRQTLSRTLADAIERNENGTINFAEVFPFEWDRVHVFSPYTPHPEIERALGFRWHDIDQTTIEDADAVNLVVFVNKGAVVRWFEHPRGQEIGFLANQRGFARDEARFEVQSVAGDSRKSLVPPEP